MGVIDTLSAGFDRLTKRLWLILLPVLLDVSIWIGPRLSVNRLSKQAIALLPNAAELGGQYPETVELLRELLTDIGETTNVLAWLSMRFLGLPSLTGSLASTGAPPGVAVRTVEIPSGLALLGWALVLTLASLLIGCLCLSFIAQDVRDEDIHLVYGLQVAGRSWVRLSMLLLLVALVVAVLFGGVGVLSGLLAVLSLDLAGLVLNLFGWGFLSLALYGAIIFFFTSRAVILDDLGIARSIWNALHVFHRNFLPAITFLMLVTILQTGLLYIWRVLAVSTIGTVIGILGNAYVGSGLVMASFIFYRDRFVAWQKAATEKGQ